MRFRNLISDFAKDKIVILSTHIVSDVSYIADTILMMKDGKLFLQEPMATVTDSINGKVWELLVSDREAVEYSSRFSVVNLHHENGKVRLRMIHEIALVADAMTVSPSLEDLFLYHFGEEAGIERREYRYIIGRMDIMPHMWQQNPCPNQKRHRIEKLSTLLSKMQSRKFN